MKFFLSVLAVFCAVGISSSLAELNCFSCDSQSDSNCATLIVLPLNSKTCDDASETQCAVAIRK